MTRTVTGCFILLPTAITLLAYSLLFAHPSMGLDKSSSPKPAACTVSDLDVDETSDIQGVIYFKAAIRDLFADQKFAELDCIADAARASKARFAGGRWKLNVLYWALSEPQGHATEEDWSAHLDTLNHWVSARPESVTARVALANAYSQYAWNARGSDYSDTVTQSGWKLFGQRIAKAKEVLEEASRLKSRCPHWFSVMQTVALAESWDLSQATTLLDQALAFEPDYYYYYRNHANYLKPQWNGEEGDAEKFAQQAADQVGGVKGDIIYFQIATEIICHCGTERSLKLMSWPRIQKGVTELEKQNGQSLTNLNLAAYMAFKESDSVVANRMFSRIGDNWDKDTWKTKSYFDSSRSWAAQNAAYLESPGHQIVEQARVRVAAEMQQCSDIGAGDMTKFALSFRVQKDGIVASVFATPETKIGLCLTKLKGEKLSLPPYDLFSFRIEVDPSQLVSAATH